MSELEDLAGRLAEFAAERDWDQFHTPKNLAMALAGEAGELLAELQWLTPDQSMMVMENAEASARVRFEVADVFIYLIRLADVLGIDLIRAAHEKVDESHRRYDPEAYRGRADKAPALSAQTSLPDVSADGGGSAAASGGGQADR